MRKLFLLIAVMMIAGFGVARQRTIVVKPVRNDGTTGRTEVFTHEDVSSGDTIYVIPEKYINLIQISLMDRDGNVVFYEPILINGELTIPIVIPDNWDDYILEISDKNGLVFREE